MTITYTFDPTGGLESLYGAWLIERGDRIVVVVDQRHFGQDMCDYSYRSGEAEIVAKVCAEALQALEGIL